MNSAMAELMDKLNDEERSAIRNLIAPAVLLAGDGEVDLNVAATEFLEAVEGMLRARERFSKVLARAGS